MSKRVRAHIRESRQREDEQPIAVGDGRVVVSHVQAEGGLLVGPGGDQVVAPSSLEDHRRMEVSDQLPAVVLERDRGHGELHVFGEQGDDAGHVARHEGVGEPLDQGLLGRRPREGGRFMLTGGLEAAVQGGPGALKGTVDRIFAGLEHVGHLGGVVAEDVSEHQNGALSWRQVLEGGDERQRDSLSRLVARLGPRAGSATSSRVKSANGSSQTTSESREGSGHITVGGTVSVNGGRRGPSRSALRHRLVATRYSHVRTDERSSKPPKPRHAANRVSCTASSASWADPRIR